MERESDDDDDVDDDSSEGKDPEKKRILPPSVLRIHSTCSTGGVLGVVGWPDTSCCTFEGM